MPTKAPTLSQRMYEARGGRANDDRAYHARRLADPERAKLERMRHSPEWRRARQAVLNRDRVCQACLAVGRTTPATQVDHIVPALVDLTRFLDLGNLQALCQPCHNRKTAAERGEVARHVG